MVCNRIEKANTAHMSTRVQTVGVEPVLEFKSYRTAGLGRARAPRLRQSSVQEQPVTSIFWYDYETTGINPRCDRPLQVAGIRTDFELNEIDEPVNLY